MLSPTIYFFHNVRTNIVRNDDIITKKKETVHHVVSSNVFSMNEIAIANKIKKLNSQNLYIFDKAERLKIGEIGPYHLDANIVRSNAQKILLTFVKRDLVYFDAYLAALSSSKIYIYNLIEGYRSLLSSINLLVSNQIIHNGLNLDTIVFCKRPILTNFSFSIDIQNTGFNWSPYFLQRKLDRFCPVEFYLLQHQLTNNQVLSVYNIETIIKQFVKDHRQDITDINVCYFAKYANKSFLTNLEEALKYWKTWDNYALSMVFIDILKNTFLKKDNKFISYFMKLLVDTLCLDPSKRVLPDILLFEDMLQKLDIKDFREVA
jgi:hypothetical protein